MSATRTDEHGLQKLPKSVRQHNVYPLTPLSALSFLALTGKKYEAETAFVRLLLATIHAAPLDSKDATALASIAILKKHPELLFMKKRVTDSYGREFFASPYQIFHGMGDLWALKQIHKDILPLIPNGETQVEIQFKGQFPNCPWPPPEDLSEEMLYDDRNKQQIEDIVKQLAVVKSLIEASSFRPNKTTVQAAFDALYKLFQPKPGEVIQSGLHFPLAIIKEIYKVHEMLSENYSLYCLTVIKPALDALSAVDGQCCQSGLENIHIETGPDRRCHSLYQHPLGRPLSLTFVEDKRCAVMVDPYDAEIYLPSSSQQKQRGSLFDRSNKNGRLKGWRGEILVHEIAPQLGEFMENKSRCLSKLFATLPKEINTPAQSSP
jgi:hypothetical protein